MHKILLHLPPCRHYTSHQGAVTAHTKTQMQQQPAQVSNQCRASELHNGARRFCIRVCFIMKAGFYCPPRHRVKHTFFCYLATSLPVFDHRGGSTHAQWHVAGAGRGWVDGFTEGQQCWMYFMSDLMPLSTVGTLQSWIRAYCMRAPYQESRTLTLCKFTWNLFPSCICELWK